MNVNSPSFCSKQKISSDKSVNEQQKFTWKNFASWAKDNKKESIPRISGLIAADVVAFSSFGALSNVSKFEKIVEHIMPVSHTKQKLLYSGLGILSATVGTLLFNDVMNKTNSYVSQKMENESIPQEE